ncbi:MAG: hypothetical protein FJZ13_00725 [Candidatus Omnitrophica bacterium]|nr:hypothetical protein [Candidatus Omnitrophota bacterium]
MTLKFNKKIYSRKAIEEAVRLYSPLVKISTAKDNSYIEAKATVMDAGLKKNFADEFANLVLVLNRTMEV